MSASVPGLNHLGPRFHFFVQAVTSSEGGIVRNFNFPQFPVVQEDCEGHSSSMRPMA